MIAGITGLTLFVATFCFVAWLCYKIYPSVFLLFRQWCNLRDLSLLPRHWLLGHLYIVRELIARVLVFCPYAYMAHRRMGRPIRVWVRLVTWWLYTYVSRMHVHACMTLHCLLFCAGYKSVSVRCFCNSKMMTEHDSPTCTGYWAR